MYVQHADLLRDGIQGDLFFRRNAAYAPKDKAMIVLGSGPYAYKGCKKTAKYFAGRGIPSLALAYCMKTGLPRDVRRIPVEYVKEAVSWLRKQGYARIGVYGVSKGAEYALCCASLLREIDFVVAVSPFDYVLEGVSLLGRSTGCSSWSYKGRELPWLPWNTCPVGVLSTSLMTGQLDMRFRYRDALRFAGERSVIGVERIKGPILFITATDDSIWASQEAVVRMLARLKAARFPHKYEHINYLYGSHNMQPASRIPLRERLLLSNPRKRGRKYLLSKRHAAMRTLRFVREL